MASRLADIATRSSFTSLGKSPQFDSPAAPCRCEFAAKFGARTREDMTMNTMNKMTTMRPIAIAIAGAMTIGVASPSWAAPALSNSAAVGTAAPNRVTDVRYYRDRYHRGYRNDGGAVIGGLVLGGIGAVAAQRYYRDRPYDGPYGYSANPYGYGYAPGYGSYDHPRNW
jgi:hypothetical protein